MKVKSIFSNLFLLILILLATSSAWAYQVKTTQGTTNTSILINPSTGVPYTSLPVDISGSGTTSKTVTTLLNAVTTNQTSSVFSIGKGRRTFQASISGTGAVSATVTWYGSNINAVSGGVLLATSTLSGNDLDASGADVPAEWPYVYCVLTNISGTGAAVTATVGA